MKTMEKTATQTIAVRQKTRSFLRLAGRHALCFALGFLYSLAGFGTLAPFGAAFAAACDGRRVLTAALGAVTGCFVRLEPVSALRYTASILALCVIFGSLRVFGALLRHPATPVVVTFVCLLSTGLAVALAEPLTASSLLLCFAEAAVGAAASFLFARCRAGLRFKSGLASLTAKDVTAVILSATLLLTSLRDVAVGPVRPVFAVTALLVLLCAYYGREAGGAIVGVCGAAVLGFGSAQVVPMGFLALGGLLAGAFSGFGRAASVAAFLTSGLVVAAVADLSAGSFVLLAEGAFAALVFLLVTQRFGRTLERLLTPSVTSPVVESVRLNIARRLQRASTASAGVYASLSGVTDALAKTERQIDVVRRTRERVCGSCGLYDACWNESPAETRACFETLQRLKAEGVFLTYKTVPQNFASRCIRTESVSESFNKLFAERRAEERMRDRLREMYALTAGQLLNLSSLLDSIRSGLDEETRFDPETAARVRAVAHGCGYVPVDCCCAFNSLDKLRIELRVRPEGERDFSALLRQVRAVTGRPLELPERTRDGDCELLTFRERAPFRVAAAGVQSCAGGEKHSGDAFTTFTDADGCFYALICDGMGTGARAAVASGIAVTLLEKLLKAGFSVNAALGTVNSALIAGSGDECSVTVDLAVIDTFTGAAEFYKYGAAESFVRKNGRVVTVGKPSLPLGILPLGESETVCGTVGSGDVIVMASDGVRPEDRDVVRAETRALRDDSVRAFSENLCELLRRYQPPKNDDLTIVTLAVLRNE